MWIVKEFPSSMRMCVGVCLRQFLCVIVKAHIKKREHGGELGDD